MRRDAQTALKLLWFAPAVFGFSSPHYKNFQRPSLASFSTVQNDETKFNLKEYVNTLGENARSSSQPGSQANLATFIPPLVILCIGLGKVPLVGDNVRDIMSWGMVASGAALFLAGSTKIGRELTPFPKPTPKSTLITEGPFDIVRHPMYSGAILSFMGIAILTDSASRVVLTVALYFLLRQKVIIEEGLLSEKFGEEYSEYKAKVPWPIVPFLDPDL